MATVLSTPKMAPTLPVGVDVDAPEDMYASVGMVGDVDEFSEADASYTHAPVDADTEFIDADVPTDSDTSIDAIASTDSDTAIDAIVSADSNKAIDSDAPIEDDVHEDTDKDINIEAAALDPPADSEPTPSVTDMGSDAPIDTDKATNFEADISNVSIDSGPIFSATAMGSDVPIGTESLDTNTAMGSEATIDVESLDADTAVDTDAVVDLSDTSRDMDSASDSNTVSDTPITSMDMGAVERLSNNTTNPKQILSLPPELLLNIFEYLSPVSIVQVGLTCKALYELSLTESLWREAMRKVLVELPPNPCRYNSFRDLYRALDPFWFLTQQGVWFSDTGMAGTLLIFRFDPRIGSLEASQVVAKRELLNPNLTFTYQESDLPAGMGGDGEGEDGGLHVRTIKVNSTWPIPALHTETSFFRFCARPDGANVLLAPGAVGPRFRTMLTLAHESVITSVIKVSLQLARALPARSNPLDPSDRPFWPPLMFPSKTRTAAFPEGLRLPCDIKETDVPTSRDEISDQAFRIVRQRHSGAGTGQQAWHMTYASLDRGLYTPTAKYPFRGIWAGNYGPHGCEFVVIHQPDDDVAAELRQREYRDPTKALGLEWERDATWEWRRKDPATYTSPMIALKLTGDPNVPRGECSFVVPSMERKWTVAGKEPLGKEGEDVVVLETRAHLAHHGFTDDSWVKGYLYLVSPDQMAHLIPDVDTILFFQRVDVDALRRVSYDGTPTRNPECT